MEGIDCHSHMAIRYQEFLIGKDAFWSKIPSMEEYEQLCQQNEVTEALLTPCPSPVIEGENYKEYVYLWNCCRGKFKYYSKICDGSLEKEYPIEKNPYQKVNDLMYNYFSRKENTKIKVHYIPLINLMFDLPEYLNELYEKGAKAFKVHGVAMGLNDYAKINDKLLQYIREHKIPLIIHTDYYECPTKPLEMLYQVSDPLNWIELLEEYGIKGYLAHGVRLCSDSMNLINKSKNWVVGISPEKLLVSEPLRLKTVVTQKEYLSILKEYLNEQSLLFDMDYPWNVDTRDGDILDFSIKDRLEEYFEEEKVKKIKMENAKEFFNL